MWFIPLRGTIIQVRYYTIAVAVFDVAQIHSFATFQPSLTTYATIISLSLPVLNKHQMRGYGRDDSCRRRAQLVDDRNRHATAYIRSLPLLKEGSQTLRKLGPDRSDTVERLRLSMHFSLSYQLAASFGYSCTMHWAARR
jgi:hypothetical protein